MRAVELAGQQFGRLKVLHRGENDKHGKSRWVCECECGTRTLANGNNLLRGISRSCGCLQREICGITHRTHGASTTKLYKIFAQAQQRCTNLNDKNFKDYGARGIEFRFTSFEQFMADLGPRPSPRHTLDRKNNSGHYEPGNIRWATRKEQSNNRRTISGEAWYAAHPNVRRERLNASE